MDKKAQNPPIAEAAQEMPLANPKGKTVEELKEVAMTLQAQVTENQRLANHHQTMATKAQGALEVMLQMIPRQEVEEMIQEEAKENHQEKTTAKA